MSINILYKKINQQKSPTKLLISNGNLSPSNRPTTVTYNTSTNVNTTSILENLQQQYQNYKQKIEQIQNTITEHFNSENIKITTNYNNINKILIEKKNLLITQMNLYKQNFIIQFDIVNNLLLNSYNTIFNKKPIVFDLQNKLEYDNFIEKYNNIKLPSYIFPKYNISEYLGYIEQNKFDKSTNSLDKNLMETGSSFYLIKNNNVKNVFNVQNGDNTSNLSNISNSKNKLNKEYLNNLIKKDINNKKAIKNDINFLKKNLFYKRGNSTKNLNQSHICNAHNETIQNNHLKNGLKNHFIENNKQSESIINEFHIKKLDIKSMKKSNLNKIKSGEKILTTATDNNNNNKKKRSYFSPKNKKYLDKKFSSIMKNENVTNTSIQKNKIKHISYYKNKKNNINDIKMGLKRGASSSTKCKRFCCDKKNIDVNSY